MATSFSPSSSSFLINSLVNLALGTRKRYIAGLIPGVVVRERHDDEMAITDHPVGYGAPITDHAFKLPESVYIEFGWSKSFLTLNSLIGGSLFSTSKDLNDVYEQLLKLQSDAEPVSIGTGKRTYSNMLIRSLTVETDTDTENVLLVRAIFRKINIVGTTELLLENDRQANPAETASMTQGGERQAEAVDSPETIS